MFAASSILFVPGSRMDRIGKAFGSAADLVCIDLEDAVAPADKDGARIDVMAALGGFDHWRTAVRMNGTMTRHGVKDLIALAESDNAPALLFVPMVEHASEITQIARVLGNSAIGLVPLIETVAGLRAAHVIAAQPGVAAMMFGGGDFSAQLGVDLAFDPLLVARGQFIMACADAGVPAIDVPFIRLDDEAGLADECRKVRALGFSAKAAIHPAQVDAINTGFGADAAAVAEARDAGPDKQQTRKEYSRCVMGLSRLHRDGIANPLAVRSRISPSATSMNTGPAAPLPTPTTCGSRC